MVTSHFGKFVSNSNTCREVTPIRATVTYFLVFIQPDLKSKTNIIAVILLIANAQVF